MMGYEVSCDLIFWYSIDDFLKTMPYLVGLCFVLGLLFQTKTHSKAHPTFATEIYPPPPPTTKFYHEITCCQNYNVYE